MQALYTDEGWVDDKADPLKWAKGLFGGKKQKKATDVLDPPAASGRGSKKGVPSSAAPDPQPKKRWPWS
jgi:hypothetical protein